MSTQEFIRQRPMNKVKVVSPRAVELAAAIRTAGGSVYESSDGLEVRGMEAAAIGELAAASGIPLHELTPEHASLEAAFIELTQEDVQYHATDVPASEGERV
jgi:ABC-2 type transport system ATP-binding protein